MRSFHFQKDLYDSHDQFFSKKQSVGLTTWHCILGAELTKMHFFRLFFLAILTTMIFPT